MLCSRNFNISQQNFIVDCSRPFLRQKTTRTVESQGPFPEELSSGHLHCFSPQTAVVRLKRSTDGLQLHPYSARSSKAHSDLSWHSHRDVRRTQRWMELSKSRPRSRSRKCRRGS
ncbi:AAEL011464-PA [Aedes aegypti]|uniref:AAEL011464-PA n=1 Tax=Aedes aegypti TaxID=7159 RepID=Q16Q04_AEDAE|nr:AAEL011464-PA [Aedes aegypti]